MDLGGDGEAASRERVAEASLTRPGLTVETSIFFTTLVPLTLEIWEPRERHLSSDLSLGHAWSPVPSCRAGQRPYLLHRGRPAAPGPAWLQQGQAAGGRTAPGFLALPCSPLSSSFLPKLTDFTKQILIQRLLPGSHCVRCWGRSLNEAGKISDLQVTGRATGIR